MVERILPRKNSFVRPAVANVDALVIFAANVNPVTEPFLIDRVAAIAGDQEVQVILCVNKSDLDPAVDLLRIYKNAGFSVISTSAETGEGVEQLRQMIQGKLTAFTGNSGVGKSSILNRLCPELSLPTGEVSEKLGRGRHTTRHVELYALDADTLVADTPGFSSFDTDQMDVILKENLQYAFPDFGEYIGKCQFHDCSHRKEPGCAVTAAVRAGELEESRYDSYLRLYEKASQIKQWELK
jgi:ribosome biogenesis GTPase